MGPHAMVEHVRRSFGMALIWGLAAAGCGEGGPHLVGVTGKVAQDGRPVEGAAVMFLPTLSDQGFQTAQDTTGPDGSFRLTTDGRPGVVPGKYSVTIIKALTKPAASTPEAFAKDPFMATMAPADPRAAKGKTKVEGDPGQFTVEREVTDEGGALDFELSKMSPGKP